MSSVVWNGMVVPEPFWNALEKALAGNITPRGVFPAALAVSVAYYENGWQLGQSRVPDPTGPNGREDSWGPFQLYKGRLGGLGTGYSTEYLNNYDNNARIAINAMASRWLATGDLYRAIEPWSVRPQAWASYQQAKFVSRSDSVPAPVGGGAASSAASPSPAGGGPSTPPPAGSAGQVTVSNPVTDAVFGWVPGFTHDAGLFLAKLAVGTAGFLMVMAGVAILIYKPVTKGMEVAGKVGII